MFGGTRIISRIMVLEKNTDHQADRGMIAKIPKHHVKDLENQDLRLKKVVFMMMLQKKKAKRQMNRILKCVIGTILTELLATKIIILMLWHTRRKHTCY